ncbi:MAG: hypothetical protein NDI84_06950 [Steroidobacteraceae bacterium]|nr:hypothetical protein [Steroidobacteraceae bacterium]
MRAPNGAGWAAAGMALLAAAGVHANESLTVNGQLRLETAFSVDDTDNPFNQRGNVFNGKETPRFSILGADTATRTGKDADDTFNYLLLRGELNMEYRINERWSATAKLRALFDPGVYEEFEPNSVGSNAAGKLYGRPNYFDYDVEGMSNPHPLEWTGENYQVYLPSLFLQYNNGPLDVRIGNQQIAWGQAIFFRVFDVVNGLDLRRHSALDYAPEEFSDKRVPSLGVRASYQFGNGWLLDGFVQKFQPTVFSNPNNPYNAIASQFTIHDMYKQYDDELSYGLRMKGDAGPFGLQAMAVRRYNPDGVYRWTESGVFRAPPGLEGTEALWAETAFEVDPSGVWSANEWFTYAGYARLNGIEGLNASIAEFPAAQALGAFLVDRDDYQAAHDELDLFFQLSGSGLRGHLAREYQKESVFGLGASYVFSGEPDSFLDQLIVNFEATYSPDRRFTNPSLSRRYIEDEEWVTALVAEKYQRFSADFPATYFVFQWMHRTQSDLFGRYLDGMGGSQTRAATGKNSWDGLVFAFQQPLPNLVWRIDFSALYDTGGGLLLQPAIRWKPSGNWTAEAFYTFMDGSIGGKSNENKNIMSTLDHADEISLRIGYQF